jgi:serine phosphatase RsbU (regulator of sigma subunit)
MKPTIADHCYGALIIGDVIGHGLNRSPGAIIAMAAFKSCYTTDPVYVQETINRVLVDVDKSSGGKAICLSIRLMENGIIEYSGKIDSFTLVEKENVRSISLSSKGEILGIQPLLLVTEKSVISMNVGDSLYLKTDGIHDLQDDKTVVIITRLSDEERLAISESSKD